MSIGSLENALFTFQMQNWSDMHFKKIWMNQFALEKKMDLWFIVKLFVAER